MASQNQEQFLCKTLWYIRWYKKNDSCKTSIIVQSRPILLHCRKTLAVHNNEFNHPDSRKVRNHDDMQKRRKNNQTWNYKNAGCCGALSGHMVESAQLPRTQMMDLFLMTLKRHMELQNHAESGGAWKLTWSPNKTYICHCSWLAYKLKGITHIQLYHTDT